jgi:hypothetical protein
VFLTGRQARLAASLCGAAGDLVLRIGYLSMGKVIDQLMTLLALAGFSIAS